MYKLVLHKQVNINSIAIIIIIMITKNSEVHGMPFNRKENKLSISSTNWLRGNSDKTNSFYKS